MAKTTETKEEVKKEEEVVVLTPSEYFEQVKSMKEKCSKEELQAFYDTAMSKFKKYMITGQKDAARHLFNLCELAKREMDIIEAGIDTYVYREDIDTYVNNVADDCVVAVELENYEREIPDDIVDKVCMCKEKNLFDKYYVFFTDYTGEHRSKVEEKKKAKDPILFGNCLIEGKVSNRMYFIGDWVDEYCSLTLDSMIEAMTREYQDGASMKRPVTPIMTLEEAEALLNGNSEDVFVSKKRNLKDKSKAVDGEAKEVKKPRRGRKKKDEK